jgi:hypothetical protein
MGDDMTVFSWKDIAIAGSLAEEMAEEKEIEKLENSIADEDNDCSEDNLEKNYDD